MLARWNYRQNLALAFNNINNDLALPEYLQVIGDAIEDEKINKQKVDEILEFYQVNRAIAIVDFLHLISAYIKIALEEAFINGKWELLCEGLSVGNKRLQMFKKITTKKIRLTITRIYCTATDFFF